GGRARDGAPRGDEGDARGPEVLHERAAVRAAWIEGHVERVAMIESHSIVERSLAVSADGQRSAEARLEEALKLGDILGQRPRGGTVEADEARRLLVPSARERPLLAHLDHA